VRYNFLILCALFAAPVLLMAALRRDLHVAMRVTALFALPFALTESWFYPEYWRPHFLFDLADHIGFGIEDFLFVAALGAFTSSIYPFVAQREYVKAGAEHSARARLRRLLLALLASLAFVGVLRLLAVPTIFATCLAMLVAALGLLTLRPDLLMPCLAAAGLTLLVYGGLCKVFDMLLPGVFELAWNTAKLSNRFLLGVPVEELLYGASAGFSGALVYPFFSGMRLARRRPHAER
jgi:hypothetical protein